MRRLMKILFLATALAAGSALAAQTTENNKTITQIGLNATAGFAYFFVAESLAVTCAGNMLVITLGDTAGSAKALYASILAAMLSGKKIGFLTYTPNVSNGYCYVDLVGFLP